MEFFLLPQRRFRSRSLFLFPLASVVRLSIIMDESRQVSWNPIISKTRLVSRIFGLEEREKKRKQLLFPFREEFRFRSRDLAYSLLEVEHHR